MIINDVVIPLISRCTSPNCLNDKLFSFQKDYSYDFGVEIWGATWI